MTVPFMVGRVFVATRRLSSRPFSYCWSDRVKLMHCASMRLAEGDKPLPYGTRVGRLGASLALLVDDEASPVGAVVLEVYINRDSQGGARYCSPLSSPHLLDPPRFSPAFVR